MRSDFEKFSTDRCRGIADVGGRCHTGTNHIDHTCPLRKDAIMNEPQVWTLIAVFAAVMLGGLTLSTNLIMRTTTAAIGGLHGEMNGLRGEMNGLRAEMNARFDAVDARFDTVDTKIDHLDRDVSLLMRRAWDEPRNE